MDETDGIDHNVGKKWLLPNGKTENHQQIPSAEPGWISHTLKPFDRFYISPSGRRFQSLAEARRLGGAELKLAEEARNGAAPSARALPLKRPRAPSVAVDETVAAAEAIVARKEWQGADHRYVTPPQHGAPSEVPRLSLADVANDCSRKQADDNIGAEDATMLASLTRDDRRPTDPTLVYGDGVPLHEFRDGAACRSANSNATLLTKNFQWTDFPKLTEYLERHRHAHSTIQNRLTRGLMKFASRNNYVFDESYFDFESIQTRVQSYYNTSINAESKQSPNKKQKQQQQQQQQHQRPTKTNTSNDSINNALSLKPVYNEGDKVYAAYWWPNQDCLWYAAVITGRHRHTSGGDTKKYGPRHTYDLEYETTEIKYNGLEEEWVFSKEDYLLTTYKANDQEWIGVKNVQDKRSKDGWARLVGWFEADILDGTRQKFSFLVQALRAYDQSVVRMKGCRTQKSDLNIVEDWFFSDHPWRDPPTLIRDDAMSPSCTDIEDGSTADCGSNGASSSTDQQDKSNVEFALGIDFSKDSEEADLADAVDWGRSMFGSYNDETIDLTESRDSDSDCSDVDDECYVISPLSEDDKTTSHDNLSTDVPQRLVHTKAPANCDADLEIQSNEESPKEASPLVAKMVAAEPSGPEPDSSNACNTWSGVFSSTNELKMPRLPVAKKVPRFSATCEVVLESFNDNKSMKKVCPYVTPLSLGLSHDSSSNTSTVIKEQKTVDFVKKDPQKVPRRSVPASSHGHVEDSSKKTSCDSSESGCFTDKMSKEEATPRVAKMNAAKSPGPEPDCSTTCNEWARVFSSTNELKMARPRAVLERLFDSSTSRKSSCTTPLSSTTSLDSSTIASLQNSDNFVRKVPQKVPRRSFPASSARYVENSPGKSQPCVMIESGGSTDKMTEDYMVQSTVDTSKSPQKVSCGSEPSTCGVSQLVGQNLDLHEEAPRIITIYSNVSSSDISLASSKKSLASSKGKGRRTGSTESRCWADHCFKFTRSKRERSEQTQTNSTSNPQVGMLSMGTKKFPRRSVADNQDTHCGESSRIPQKEDMCMKYFEQWQECDQHRGDAVENSPKFRNWIVKQQIMYDSLKSDEKSKLNSGNAVRRKVTDASVETNLSAGHSSATYSERKSLKPILENGDSVVVVSCPSSDSNLCQTGYSATVKDRTKVRNNGQYGDVWQYDVITGDGGVIHNIEESCVFPKRDRVLSSLKKDAKDWIGVKRVRDADSIDLWAKDVGWYAALVNGRYHHFPLLADALRVRDDFVVKLNGRRTKESDLNIPEEWTLPKQQGGKGPTYIGIDDKKPPCFITDPDLAEFCRGASQEPKPDEETCVESTSESCAVSIKPSIKIGDEVYARRGKGARKNRWMHGRIWDIRVINCGDKYGPVKSYDIVFDNGDTDANIKETEVVTNEGSEPEQDLECPVGVKHVFDKSSADEYARVVGWWETYYFNGDRCVYKSLVAALVAYDKHIRESEDGMK